MMLLWAFAGLPLGVHNILADENGATSRVLLTARVKGSLMSFGLPWNSGSSGSGPDLDVAEPLDLVTGHVLWSCASTGPVSGLFFF